jgi:hypothetical protein
MLTSSSTNADTAVGSVIRLTRSWAISLAAENKSPQTIGGWRAVEGHGDEDLAARRARARQLRHHVSPGHIGKEVRHPAGTDAPVSSTAPPGPGIVKETSAVPCCRWRWA